MTDSPPKKQGMELVVAMSVDGQHSWLKLNLLLELLFKKGIISQEEIDQISAKSFEELEDMTAESRRLAGEGK